MGPLATGVAPVSARTHVCRDRLLLAGRTDETLNSTPLTVARMAVTAAGESDMLGCAALRASFSTADSSECLQKKKSQVVFLFFFSFFRSCVIQTRELMHRK